MTLYNFVSRCSTTKTLTFRWYPFANELLSKKNTCSFLWARHVHYVWSVSIHYINIKELFVWTSRYRIKSRVSTYYWTLYGIICFDANFLFDFFVLNPINLSYICLNTFNSNKYVSSYIDWLETIGAKLRKILKPRQRIQSIQPPCSILLFDTVLLF